MRYLQVLLALVALAGCSNQKAEEPKISPAAAAAPVKVAKASRKTVPVQLTAIGTVQPYSTVQVKSEVAGQLMKVGFTGGQDVRQGDLLFVIDPRPLEAIVKQLQANLARDRAQAANARADADRFEALFKQGIIARQQFEQYRTNAEALAAAEDADRASLENARVQLGYTTIRSPLSGRTGDLLVHEGNLVKEKDTMLVVINQIQPIYVAFSVPGPNLPAIKRYMDAGLQVKAVPKDTGAQAGAVSRAPAWGRLTFIDNSVDASTGTILLKATFQNEDRSLWPGDFVDVVLTLTTEPHAVVIPSEAVQNGQQGQYVFVVKPDSTVESRPITIGRALEQQTVVTRGLNGSETVVTDGQLRLAPGARVKVLGTNPPAAQSSPAR